MVTATAVVVSMLVGSMSLVVAKEYCNVDYPEYGMSRVTDEYCSSNECQTTPNCTIGCIGADIETGCSWCVWDMKQCQEKFEPKTTDSMCAKFALYSLNRSKHSDGPKCKRVAPHFESLKNYCFSEDHPVPNLVDGFMTPESAQFACFNSRDGRSNNCKGFQYYNLTEEQSSLLQVGEPNLQCGVDLPWYGMKLITDTKCTDPTCINECRNGCIGTDNATCARCIYNYRSCNTTLGEKVCDELVKGQEIRKNPDCTAPIHHGVYVKFSSVWDPIPASSGKCTGQLGAPVGTPYVNFNPTTVETGTTFDGEVQKIQLKNGQTQFASARAAYNACYEHANDDANKDAPCSGFNYSNPNDDPLETMADFTFMTGRLDPTNNAEQVTYIATWKAPTLTPPPKEELMV